MGRNNGVSNLQTTLNTLAINQFAPNSPHETSNSRGDENSIALTSHNPLERYQHFHETYSSMGMHPQMLNTLGDGMIAQISVHKMGYEAQQEQIKCQLKQSEFHMFGIASTSERDQYSDDCGSHGSNRKMLGDQSVQVLSYSRQGLIDTRSPSSNL